jgi:lipopolysaccharide export system protein LptA
MLRNLRGLLLIAILAILAAVGYTYYRQHASQARQAAPTPKSLPLDTDAAATDWVWTKDEGSRRKVQVRARNFRQVSDPSQLELEGVELLIYDKDGKTYDRVRSARANFDTVHGTLYSDGEVEIVMGVPAEGKPPGRLVRIVSSGVTFESNTSRAHTPREARFEFDQGEGRATGASYDPNARELVMRRAVEVNWRGRGPESKPMKVEAGELIYKEADSYILLNQWARLTRGSTLLEGSQGIVNLREGAIERVEVHEARGSDRYPKRSLEYSAGNLFMHFSPEGEVRKIEALDGARLVSQSDSGRTTVTGRRIDLEFETKVNESVLKNAAATGAARVESVPAAKGKGRQAETRVLHSENIFLAMRPGGEDIDRVDVRTPGRLEFVPNAAGQRHRTLDATEMAIQYGAENQIRSFRAKDAATRTDPAADRKKDAKAAAPVLTWSKELEAEFDSATGQLARLEQWENFRYEEGEKKARAHRAVLEEGRRTITLEREARSWDPSGSISADRIVLDQNTGDVVATGNVISTRMPDRKGRSSAALSSEEPLEATSERMQTFEGNQRVRHEGNAVAWQGADRINADWIEIDRRARKLTAGGKVRTQFLEEPKPDAKQKGPARAPVFVVVESAALVYTEADRLAHYTGGAHLARPGMEVRSREIRAYLSEPGKEESLDRMFADGDVEIVRTQPGRIVNGTSEHAEYWAADQRIELSGGQPVLADSARGTTKGSELTYFPNEDKLLVNGRDSRPVVSRIKKR